jgi:hypothetical protein
MEMVKTTMDIEARLHHTANHEVLHTLFALSRGLDVHRVSIRQMRDSYGRTVVAWPWPPAALWEYYRRQPLTTLAQLRAVMGTLLAPSILQGAASPLAGGDKACVEMWCRRWDAARRFSDPHGPRWGDLRAQVEQEVIAWYWREGCKEQREAVAKALVQHGSLSATELRTLIRHYPVPAKVSMRHASARPAAASSAYGGLYDLLLPSHV